MSRGVDSFVRIPLGIEVKDEWYRSEGARDGSEDCQRMVNAEVFEHWDRHNYYAAGDHIASERVRDEGRCGD